jgi:hypothetical protein
MALTIEELHLLDWRKARRSMGNGDCVEIAPMSERILLRDSKDLAGPILECPCSSWVRFTMKIKNGIYDIPHFEATPCGLGIRASSLDFGAIEIQV